MEKPATILIHEFKDKIVSAVNSAGLPAFAIALVLRQMLAEVENIETQQYLADVKAYEEAQNAERKPVD